MLNGIDLRLEELAIRINENLVQEANSSNELKWERALLYSEARSFFKSDKLFGQWRESYCTVNGALEHRNVASKLIMSTVFLTKEQFIKMGYGNAAELMVKTAWKSFEPQMKELANHAHDYSQRKLRDAVQAVKVGVVNVYPEPTLPSPVDRIAQLKTELEILQHTYTHPETFFHPEKYFSDLQKAELNKGNKYCLVFFGLPSTFTEEQLSSAYRALSLRYHPDRVGSGEVMVLINRLRDHLRNYLFVSTN